MPAGRPTLYKPEYCEQVIAMGKEGQSVAQMCSKFDISRQTIDNWAEEYPEFLEAFTRAKAHMQAWWESEGQKALTSDKFNSAVWSKTMSARFREDYTERRDLNVKGNHTVTHESKGLSESAAFIVGVVGTGPGGTPEDSGTE